MADLAALAQRADALAEHLNIAANEIGAAHAECLSRLGAGRVTDACNRALADVAACLTSARSVADDLATLAAHEGLDEPST